MVGGRQRGPWENLGLDPEAFEPDRVRARGERSDGAREAGSDDAADGPASRRAWRVLLAANALVFASSMCIMILELVAARLVAQSLGVSLYTWTAVIGVILAGISLGNYVGGRLADRRPPRDLLPVLLGLASVLSFSVLWLTHLMDQFVRPEALSWPAWILVNVAVVFLLPAAVLGTIAPVAAKWALDARRRIGSTVGSIYAWGAVGSIVGTFLTGFFLVDLLGSRAIVVAVAAGLALLGLATAALRRRRDRAPFLLWLGIMAVTATVAFAPWSWARQLGHFFLLRPDTRDLEYFDESNYFAIKVYEDGGIPDTLVLSLDNLVHSYVPTDDITRLVYNYETVYAAVTDRVLRTRRLDRPPRTLFIGGGGYVFPRYVEEVYPGSRIDVAEIDPAVAEAARKALELPPPDETRIRNHAMDARNYVADRLRANRAAAGDPDAEPVTYDLVYGDAFNDLSVPFHLTTREFNESVRGLLAPGGVYMINLIDIYREGLGRFLGAFVATLRETFPCIYVFSSDPEGPVEYRDTFVVVAAASPLGLQDLGSRPEDPSFDGTLFAWVEGDRLGGEMATVLERSRGIVLTDDYAPVDNLLLPLHRNR